MSGDVSQWARGLIWSSGGRRKTILRGYGFLMSFYAIFVFLSRSNARKTIPEIHDTFLMLLTSFGMVQLAGPGKCIIDLWRLMVISQGVMKVGWGVLKVGWAFRNLLGQLARNM